MDGQRCTYCQAIGACPKCWGREAIDELTADRADLIAIGRQALYDPFWALHAAQELGCDGDFEMWTPEYGWWLEKRKNNLPK